MNKTPLKLLSVLMLSTFALPALASEMTQCVMKHFESSDDALTLKEIRALCRIKVEPAKTILAPEKVEELGLITQRVLKESRTEFNPYVITPHRMNYFLPVYSTNRIHRDAYTAFNGYEANLEDLEAKFQLSLKVPMNEESLFIAGDGLYLGFTLQALWQVYASKLSKPFRETNYQPEVFYLAPLGWEPFGGYTGFVVGLEHQSNGQAQLLSRSWNRFYGHFLFEKDNFALSFKPWIRIKEDEKASALDPNGDDNPDIADYLGHFELGMVYKWDDFQLSLMTRRNFATHNGALELGLTFPLWGKLRGYATAFSGYGDSLIDYNHKQTRFGFGIALNDIL